MPSSLTPLVNWQAIQPHGGSKAAAFEELCCQLARAEESEGEFIRKGTPDAGNECYRRFSNGREWGWQAKYVDGIDDSLLKQIDKSVKAALQGHPDLVRYHICLPFNLPDARLSGQQSQRDKWNRRILKWTNWSTAKGMNVEFTLWGDSELVSRLSDVRFKGKLRYFFGAAIMDPNWFNTRLAEAIDSVGVRYTPELHQELQIAQDFEAFGRTDAIFDRIRALASPIKRALDAAAWMTRPEDGLPPEEAQVNDATFHERIASVFSQVSNAVELFSSKAEGPIGPIPQASLLELLPVLIEELQKIDGELFDADSLDAFEHPLRQTEQRRNGNAFNRRSRAVYTIQEQLSAAHATLSGTIDLLQSSELLIKGGAGLGKTHLLCDVAKKRLEHGLPTILLLGKRFRDSDPWTEALQQLDCRHWDTDEFIGALESAAQAASHRALLLIDGLNEGAGKRLWPDHLTAFLHRVSQSKWIAVVLTVRSSYVAPLPAVSLLPAEVLGRIAVREHHGFDGVEYNASRTFFAHYGIDFPVSSPWLISEFRNPLFLKLLCEGVKKMGLTAVPVGLDGISQVFALYLDGINQELSRALDYLPSDNKVRQAIDSLAVAMSEGFSPGVEYSRARSLIDQIHPSTGVTNSLFLALVENSVLMVDQHWTDQSNAKEIVFPSYDRLTDHLVASALLDRHLDTSNPRLSFAQAPLSEVVSPRQWRHQGLIEALCIQVPERTGMELLTYAPSLTKNHGFPDAFRQSIYWRKRDAFGADFDTILNDLLSDSSQRPLTEEALLSVATIPDHPYNAESLHEYMLQLSMPKRDELWSILLHYSWSRDSEAWRVVEWARAIPIGHPLDERVVELAFTTLGWLLTASNRFIRDRATKALVNLLCDRLTDLEKFVLKFREVNDLYVVERVYAVAYGVVMKSWDKVGMSRLAQETFDYLFASGNPTPHILLREYARGVIERAVFLGVTIHGNLELIRPPYHSDWPELISMDEFQALRKGRTGHTLGYNRIISSVLHDDFAQYIIGTNAGGTRWLSLPLAEQPWQSNQDQLDSVVSSFSIDERRAWDALNEIEQECRRNIRLKFRVLLPEGIEKPVPRKELSEVDHAWWREEADVVEAAELHLRLTLRPSLWKALQRIRKVNEQGDSSHPPEFPKTDIQRYVVDRVFELGWTEQAFGQFDGRSELMSFREARKAERIGKKYQWIAYHEFCAFLSDHFQYRDPYSQSRLDRAYQGAWQLGLRDIDTSHTLRKMPIGINPKEVVASWWSPCSMQWGLEEEDAKWVTRTDDLPRYHDLFLPEQLHKGKGWVNLDVMRSWHQPIPEDTDPYEVDRRELWMMGQAYLIKTADAPAFMDWTRKVNFWGRWMPKPLDRYELALGEHHWSHAARFFEDEYYGRSGWITPERDCPVQVIVPSINYLNEKGLDCSLDSSISIAIPSSALIERFNLHWSGIDSDYLDEQGNLVAFDPTVNQPGAGGFLIERTFLHNRLQELGLALCWTTLGEKKVRPGRQNGYQKHCVEYSGAFQLMQGGVRGFVHGRFDKGGSRGDDSPPPAFTLEFS